MNRYLSYAICHRGFEKRIAIVGGIVRFLWMVRGRWCGTNIFPASQPTDQSKQIVGWTKKKKYRIHNEYSVRIIGNTWRGISSWRSRDGKQVSVDGMGLVVVLWLSGWGCSRNMSTAAVAGCFLVILVCGWEVVVERWGWVPFPGVLR